MSIVATNNVVTQRIADGDYGAWQTLQAMKDIVNKYPCKELLRQIVAKVTGGCTTDRCKIDHIYEWVRGIMKYKLDPLHAEQLKSPCRLMTEASNPGGPGYAVDDCDGFAVMLSAAYVQAGLKAAFLAVSSQPKNPQAQVPLDHVTAVVLDRQAGKWISTDPVAGAKTWQGHRAMLEML